VSAAWLAAADGAIPHHAAAAIADYLKVKPAG